jgi:protein SCO1/2
MLRIARLGVAATLALALSPAAAPRPGIAAGDRAVLPVYETSDLTPLWLDARQLQGRDGRFPGFELQDQAGRPLRRDDLEGRIVVANFFFVGCSTLCPRLRNAMARVRDAVRGDEQILLLSHSVTPEADSAPVLAAYARANGVDGEQWRLLTGSRESILRVAHEGYLVPRPEATRASVLHTELFVLLDQRQRVRGVYNGTLGTEIANLIEDIRVLQGGG